MANTNSCGCLTCFADFKQSVNERYAHIRDRFRRRGHTHRHVDGQLGPIDTRRIFYETDNGDIVFIPVMNTRIGNQDRSDSYVSPSEECLLGKSNIGSSIETECSRKEERNFSLELGDFVFGVVKKSANALHRVKREEREFDTDLTTAVSIDITAPSSQTGDIQATSKTSRTDDDSADHSDYLDTVVGQTDLMRFIARVLTNAVNDILRERELLLCKLSRDLEADDDTSSIISDTADSAVNDVLAAIKDLHDDTLGATGFSGLDDVVAEADGTKTIPHIVRINPTACGDIINVSDTK